MTQRQREGVAAVAGTCSTVEYPKRLLKGSKKGRIESTKTHNAHLQEALCIGACS